MATENSTETGDESAITPEPVSPDEILEKLTRANAIARLIGQSQNGGVVVSDETEWSALIVCEPPW
ncbi:MAG: hypothetical protein ACREX4_04150 [Gammaproteobacteria bacterium]